MSSTRSRGYAALVLVQILFGLWPTMGAHALTEVPPHALVGFRTVLAALTFSLVALSQGHRFAKNTRPKLTTLLVLGILGVSVNQLWFIEGLARAGPVNAILLIVVIPAGSLGFAMLLRQERAQTRRIVGIAIAAIGLIVMASQKSGAGDDVFWGRVFIIGNTLAYALYLVLAKPAFERFGALAVLPMVFVMGALTALPWTLPSMLQTAWLGLSTTTYAALGFILLGPTLGTYALNAYALRHVDSSVVAVFIGLQPLVGTLASWALLGLRAQPTELIAGAVILCGVLVSAWTRPTQNISMSSSEETT